MPAAYPLICLLLWFISPLGAAEEAPPADAGQAAERVTPESAQTRFNRELITRYQGSDLVELPSAEGNFIALYQARRSSRDRGGVILLAAPGQHADWPQLVAPLRDALPDQGWHSLSLAPPPLPAPTPPEAAETDSASGEAGKSVEQSLRREAQQAYQRWLGGRINSASEHLTSLGISHQVLLLVGGSAAPAMATLAEQKSPWAALVLINAENDPEGNLIKQLEQFPTLTLDLHYGQQQQEPASERLAAARRANNNHYFSRPLEGPQNDTEASGSRLLKAVGSWLNRYPGGPR
ncbi:DUF3530 family protein [Aestuariirhabdus litorea]|nr:DUF3530 family protein [Aestuariirhabdus litorea]